MAGDARDIVFDCPCRAEWTAGEPGGAGELALTFGVRNLRATESGEVRLSEFDLERRTSYLPDTQPESVTPFVGRIPAMAVQSQVRRMAFDRPVPGQPIGIDLWERVAQTPVSAADQRAWHRHEVLALWPVAGEGGDRIAFVDVLTDTDGDGVGDVNEELAGTSPSDAASTPGTTTIDVLALYNDGLREALDGYPYTRIQHLMVLTSALYADSGTNFRLRMVGAQEVELDASGIPEREAVVDLMERYGADLSFRFHGGETPMGCPVGAGGCAVVGGAVRRGYWRGDEVTRSVCRGTYSALCAAHELGHNLGLVHSARQGEAVGAFRWSRGQYVGENRGTIMSYGVQVLGGVFSDPAAVCEGTPCGVPINEAGGAHAVKSIDLVRFQVARNRVSKPDTDGDGIVDPADAFPDDPADWVDLDGDGVGDVADPDDDNDGVADTDDAFPFDPTEWEDLDADGIGDNADDDVVDLAPFQDPALRAAVERALGKEPGAPITAEDLSALTVLAVPYQPLGQEIRDLTGLELAESLTELELPFNAIADLSPLSDLEQLELVRLSGNEVADLAPLQGVASLREVWLAYNPVSDLSPLVELPVLDSLFVGGDGHALSDLSPLAELTNLRTLGAIGVGLSDLSLLSELKGLSLLWIRDNPVTDLSPLGDLAALSGVDASGTGVSDLSPLSRFNLLSLDVSRTSATLDDVARMRPLFLFILGVGGLGIDDLSPLSEFGRLGTLDLGDNEVADLSPLRDMPDLAFLDLPNNRVSDLGPLGDLSGLWSLDLAGNDVSDIGPLAGHPMLGRLDLSGGSHVSDLGPLADLAELWSLDLSHNGVTDVGPLADLSNLIFLDLPHNDVSDLGPLGGLSALRFLDLTDNDVSDVGPLGGLSGLTSLRLTDNDVSDIGPLVHREIWDLDGGAFLLLNGNPLDDTSLREHIPTLESWGVRVVAPPVPSGDPVREVVVADPALHALIAQAVAGGSIQVDDPITTDSIGRLTRLHAFNAGVSNLTGLDAAGELADIFLGSNLSSDLSPLAALKKLEGLDLSDNLVSDLSPLVDNPHVDAGDWITLTGNPLSEASFNVHVPALRERGVHVGLDSVRLLVSPDARAASFEVSGYFAATLGSGASVAAASDDPDGPRAEVVDGELRVALSDSTGPGTLTVTGTNDAGATETLAFHVSLRQVVALFPAAASPVYQGFVRVINHSPRPGRVVIHATDDDGRRYDPVTVSMAADQVVHFNSQDLEHGNPAKGLADGIGAGAGDWRLDLGSNLDIEALGYARTADGFVTALHDLAPASGDDRALAIFNPGSNRDQVSLLRLVNHGEETAEVTVRGVDDQGQSPGRAVLFTLPPGTARAPTAADLESGAEATGALGDGAGKWRLTVESTAPVYAMSLLESPTGHLTNLSSGPVTPVGGAYSVPLFPSAADPDSREGFVRVVNRETRAGPVTITAVDDAGRAHGDVTLALGAGQTVHFNSEDLEGGNAAKGLTGGVGAGSGNWRLALSGDVDIDVLGYIRHVDGFLTSMHDAAPVADTRHRITFFNPGSNRAQVSSLRLINPGSASASVTITGRDDSGASPGGPVQVTLLAGAARTYTAEQLEDGGVDLDGALGDGVGKWRLLVESTGPISAMSLLASPTGHLTNLSTAPMR